MKTVQDKYIWIIGASSGIGEAVAKKLAAEGAHLILSARSEDKLKSLNASLGDKHLVVPFDAGDIAATEYAAQAIHSQTGRIDAMLFMAAIYAPHTDKPKDTSFMHQMLTVNVGGAFNAVQSLVPIYEQQGEGSLILCASVAGYRGLPYGQPYCATKAALINYAESIKIELETKNIDVKIISPGFVKTQLTDKNDFKMPMIIEADEAADAIHKGMTSNAFEIHFPKKFTYIMKIIDALPRWLYFLLGKKIREERAKGLS